MGVDNPSVETEALHKRIEQHVRAMIETGEVSPGERLPTERELAERLGVSRMPIREAIRTLSAQGLVEVRGRRGMFVAPRNVDATVEQLTTVMMRQRAALDELLAVRRLLEPASAQWAAARADEEGIAHLRSILARMEAASAVEPPDYDALRACDTEFHVTLAACSGNAVLRRILEAIQDLHSEQIVTTQRYRGRLRQTLDDHRRLVDAIAARDPIAAHDLMLEHLARTEVAAHGRIDGDAGR